MFLKILLIVIILLSLLFLSFSFKLVFHKKQQLPKTADDISHHIQSDLKDKNEVIQDRNHATE